MSYVPGRDPISVRLPDDLRDQLDQRVAEDRVKITEVVVRALREHFGLLPSDAPGLFANQEAIRGAVNDHETRLSKLERLAESSGAL